MNKLQFDFSKVKVTTISPDESSVDLMYWIYPDEEEVPYRNATSTEIWAWAVNNILPEQEEYLDAFLSIDPEELRLTIKKASTCDLVCRALIDRYKDLFGPPEFWESLEEWQRLQKMEAKKNG